MDDFYILCLEIDGIKQQTIKESKLSDNKVTVVH